MRPPRVRPSTWASYRMNVEKHIVPALGRSSSNGSPPRTSPPSTGRCSTTAAATGRRPGAQDRPQHPCRSCTRRCGTRCAGATSSATSPTRPTCRRAWHPRCASGARRSSAPSSTTFAATGCMRPGCCSRRPGCGAARSPGCAGPTSTWRPAGSRRGGPASSWTTRCTSRSRRRPRAAARWPWTRRRWRRCASTAPARPRSGWRWGRAGRTPGLVFTWPDGTARPSGAVLQMVRAARPGGRPPEDPAARCAPQLRDAALAAGVPAKVVSERLGPRQHRHHDGHLQPRPARPGRRRPPARWRG